MSCISKGGRFGLLGLWSGWPLKTEDGGRVFKISTVAIDANDTRSLLSQSEPGTRYENGQIYRSCTRRGLQQISQQRGVSKALFCDNGSESASKACFLKLRDERGFPRNWGDETACLPLEIQIS